MKTTMTIRALLLSVLISSLPVLCPAANIAPVFSATTNRYVISGGATISITNTATDADSPSQTLTYALATAPVDATINAANGVVTWVTTTNHAGTSNFFRVVVTDNGGPPLSATNSFTVFVRSLKPNVILIVTDDQGYHDINAHGAEAPTPNMDRLGSEGIRLERFYATPVCSVTRSTLLTGRSTLRTSVGNARGLDLHEHIMPQTFKAAGYQASMVGKWHLGGNYNNVTNTVINGVTHVVVKNGVEYQPQNRGWDYHYGQYSGAVGYQTHINGLTGEVDWWLNGQTNYDVGWSTDLLADRAASLIQNRDPSKPVILYVAFNAVHPGVSAPASYLNKYLSIADVKRRTMVAALDQLDVSIGRVLDTLDSENITTNTLVVFFSDNGADTNSGGLNIPLRGTKNDYFEAGIHTPAAVRWPGVITAGVTNCNQFVSVADIFPTICAATGVTPLNTKPFDGTNVWPLLLNATNGAFNPTSYRGRPLFSGSASGAQGSAVYDVFSNGTNLTMFKLIHYTAGTDLLFDIISDPTETNNVVNVPAYTNIVLALKSNYTATAVAERYGPYIGVQPQSQSVGAGSNVTLFAMTTVYTTPLGVQWRKNGTNIAGATSYTTVDQAVYLTTLTLSNVTPGDAASYDVLVTNAAVGWPNRLSSLPAALTVTGSASNTAPVLVGIPSRTIAPGITLLITNVATDAEAPPQLLTFSLPVAPGGATIDATSGVITWAASAANANTTNSFIVLVADNGTPSLTATQGFTVTVLGNGATNGGASQWSMLKLPDTGQTNNYGTPVFGADSDYTINPPSFTNNSNGTTTDNVTGLIWQRVDGGEMTWTNALLFAATNTLGGLLAGSWRLPSVHELASILIYSRENPALNTNYFLSGGGTNADYWWSKDTLATDHTRVWVSNAGGGVGPKVQTETLSAGGTLRYHARLVRGPATPTNSPIHHLYNNGNGTITDLDTGLIWQRGEATAMMNWTNAILYAESLTLAAFTDWRLPNIKELESLNDETLASPSIDTSFFPNAKSARYWSSTTQNNRSTNAWWNEFIAGITSQSPKVGSNWVRAVRGPFTLNAPVLAVATNAPGTGFRLSVQGDSGHLYIIQGSSNFSNWMNLFTTNSPATPFLWTDPDTSLPWRFYRVLVLP